MSHSVQYWEYRLVEAMFVPDPQHPQELSDQVMFFDHYAKAYREQKSDLDDYFAKLASEGWELTIEPWAYDKPGKDADDSMRPLHSGLDRLFWLHDVPGRKLYRFKRPVKR